MTAVRIRRSSVAISLTLGLLLPAAVGVTAAGAHPELFHSKETSQDAALSIGVQVNAPDGLVGFHPGVQWSDAGEIDFQTADFVYAGTGCTPASYAAVATEVRGNIALVDERVSQTNPLDQCPAFSFFQKVQSAQQAGAIGFVQIPGEAEGDDTPREDATAGAADIPAMELFRTEDIVAVRDAVVERIAVNVTLTPVPAPDGQNDVACEDGSAGSYFADGAGPYECDGIDLLALVPRDEFAGAADSISDIWGWTDPENGDEYVILGKTDGVAFFRVSDPTDPVYLGELPNQAEVHRTWHDIKVFDDHAFIVSESEPHGMTVFDLTRLRGVEEAQEWDQDAFYRLHSAAHNLDINTDTGFAYIVGGNGGLVVPDQCLSGLHMVDINDPTNPIFAGCYLEEGGPGTAARSVGAPATDVSPAAYVHDSQCVIYDGPDERYTDREICFMASETLVVIADVTDKLLPTTLGTVTYDNAGYTHQGWLTDDQAFWIANDELDESTGLVENTRTIVLDVSDLENPQVHFEHFHETVSPDHNNYVHEGLLYQSNYSSGLRVLDLAFVDDPDEPRLEEVAFFDTYPFAEDTFDGTWSNYPFFESGTIAVSGRNEGLFLLRLQDDLSEPAVDIACTNCPVEIRAGESGTAELAVSNVGNVDDTYGLAVSELPERWSASLDPEVAVAAGDVGGTAVTVQVPRRARAGTYAFTVTATSSVDPQVAAATVVEVEVFKGPPSGTGPPADRSLGQQAPRDAGGQPADATLTAAAARTDATTAVTPAVALALAVAMLLLGSTTWARRRVRRAESRHVHGRASSRTQTGKVQRFRLREDA